MTNNIYKGAINATVSAIKKRAGEVFEKQREKAVHDMIDYMDMIMEDHTIINNAIKYDYMCKVVENYKQEIYNINRMYIRKIVEADRFDDGYQE